MRCLNRGYWIAGQAGVVPLALSQPGTGKTRSTEAFARFVNRHLAIVIGSHHDPAEICGYPYPEANGDGRRVMRFLLPEWQYDCIKAPIGAVAFFDEFTTSPPANQAAMLQVLNDGIPNTWLFSAANPPECAANGFDLEPPTVNRLCVLPWEDDCSLWCEQLLGGFIDTPDYPILPANWQAKLPIARSMLIGYLHRCPHKMQQMPDVHKERSAAGKPWPSKRSWTNSATLLAAAMAINEADETKIAMVIGCVGEAGHEFFTYMQDLDLPDVEEWLADHSKIKLPDRHDRAFVACGALVSAVLHNNTRERWESCMGALAVISDTSMSAAVAVAGSLATHRPKGAVPPEAACNRLLPVLEKCIPKEGS